jgi:hypothetical protein
MTEESHVFLASPGASPSNKAAPTSAAASVSTAAAQSAPAVNTGGAGATGVMDLSALAALLLVVFARFRSGRRAPK